MQQSGLIFRRRRMIFFNKNREDDRNFLKLQTQLNYSYWIACDVDSYYENSKSNINSFEYAKMQKQHALALDMFNNIDIDEFYIGPEHKRCLEALKIFVESGLDDFHFSGRKKFKDSESEEINLLYLTNIEKEFRSVYLNYLHPREAEGYIMKSYAFFEKGVEFIMQLSSEMEFSDDEKIDDLSQKTIQNFRLARNELEKAKQDQNVFEFMLDELTIISSGKLLEKEVKEFIDLNFSYLDLWIEYFLIHERYCNDIFDKDNDEESASEVFEFESNNCLSFINVLAIKINLFILKKMKVDVADLEIYSQRSIRSPIDYINNMRR